MNTTILLLYIYNIYYLWLNQCREIVLLIWTWCKLSWPNKDWIIVEASGHAFVMEMDNVYTIYDILYQSILQKLQKLRKLSHGSKIIDINFPRDFGG